MDCNNPSVMKEQKIDSSLFNGYKIKRSVSLVTDNKPKKWLELKTGGPFSIMYDPNESVWLKTVLPQHRNTLYEDRIEQSCEAQQEMLSFVGSDDIAKQCRVVKINWPLDDFSHKAFLSPHFGPTIQYLQKEKIYSEKDLNDFYYLGLSLAKQLLKKIGLWVDDPNPGNIIINDDSTKYNRVVLIDFSNKIIKRKDNLVSRNELEKSFYRNAIKAGLSGWN